MQRIAGGGVLGGVGQNLERQRNEAPEGGGPGTGRAAWRALWLCGAFGALLAGLAVRAPSEPSAGAGAAAPGTSAAWGLGLAPGPTTAREIETMSRSMGALGVRELRGLPTIGGRRAVDLAREAWARGGALPLDRWADLPGIGAGSVGAVRAELERRAGAR